MAKLSSILRNEKREKMATKQRAKRKTLRTVVSNPEASEEEKTAAHLKLQKLARNGSDTRVRLRCGITGRSRGNFRKFGVCRIKFRELALAGKLPGVTKASW